MAQVKTLPVPVVNGMRQDVSARMSPPGTIVYAENVRFQTPGEVHSRPGTQGVDVSDSNGVPYSGVLNDAGPDFLTAVPGGFVFGAGGFGWRYDYGQDALHIAGSYSNAVPRGRFAVIAGEESNYTLGNHAPWPTSVAVGLGYVAICWSTGNGQQGISASGSSDSFKIQVFTEAGTLVTTIYNSNYQAAWVLFDSTSGTGGAFIVVAQQDSSGTPTSVDAARITLDATSALLSAFSNVATLNGTTACWAACEWEGGNGWALVHQSGATTATITKLTGTTVSLTQTFATAGATSPLSVYCDSTNLYAGFVDVGANSVARARVYSAALVLASGGSVTLYTDTAGAVLSLTPPLFGPSVTAGSAFVAIGRATSIAGSDTASTWTLASHLTAAGVHTTPNSPVYGMFPIGAPFNNGMVWCRYRTPNATNIGNSYVRNCLLDFQSARVSSSDPYWRYRFPRIALTGDPFADPAPGDYRSGIAFLHLSTPQQLINGNWLAGMPRLVRSEELSAASTSWGLAVAEWLEFSTEARRAAKHVGGGECMVPGAVAMVGSGGGGSFNYNSVGSEPSVQNQAAGVDQGFYFEPSIDAGAQSNTAAGELTASGDYYYRRVIEWIDGQGRRHRSRASRAQHVGPLGVGNDTVTFTAADDFAWLREGRVSVPSAVVAHYYRTTSGGSTFYRATPPQGAPAAGASATFVDIISDTKLRTREILYTDGGVLDNESPPSCRLISLGEDRVWVAGLWDKRVAKSSKIIVPGEPIQFSDSPAFDVVIPDDVTAIAAQDGVQVFFCRSAVYAVQGLGPNDQGEGDWGSPRVITRSTGCTNELSVLETGVGIFFQSSRGIELLPRGLAEPVPIGEPVADELSNGEQVSRASVVSKAGSTTARFALQDVGSPGSTRVLVYEMRTGAWSVDRYPVSINAICDTDEGAVLGLLTVTSNLGFLRESTVRSDGSGASFAADVASVVTWADVRLAGPAGQGRFNEAACGFDEPNTGYPSAGTITLTVQVDNAVDPGAAFGTGSMDSIVFLKHLPAQVAGSGVKLQIATTKAGWKCFGWTLGFDDMGGTRRTASTEQG